MSCRKNIIFWCLFFSTLLALAEEAPSAKDDEFSVKENSVTDLKGNEYFPKTYDNWYSPHLRAMGESSMFSGGDSKMGSQFRFLYLSTFSKPISFRGFIKGGRFYIRVVRLTGKGGYDPGGIEISVNVEITEEEWLTLEEAVVRSFEVTQINDEQRDIIAGLDGSQWVLEANIGGKYHFEEAPQAAYWTSEDGIKVLTELEYEGMNVPVLFSFVDACKVFLTLTDFTLPSRKVPAELGE